MSSANVANEPGTKPSKPVERTEGIGEFIPNFSSAPQIPKQQDAEAKRQQAELQLRERAKEFYDHPFRASSPESSPDKIAATPEQLELERGYQALREIMQSRQQLWNQGSSYQEIMDILTRKFQSPDPSSAARDNFTKRQELWDHAPVVKDLVKMLDADQKFRSEFEKLIGRYSKGPSVGDLNMPGGLI